MSSEPINAETSARICTHMNQDHSDSLKDYASHYGGLKHAKVVEMVNISSVSMELKVDERNITIRFDHELADCSDAHKTLIEMIKSIPKS